MRGWSASPLRAESPTLHRYHRLEPLGSRATPTTAARGALLTASIPDPVKGAMADSLSQQKQQLRRELRAARRALSPTDQVNASLGVCRQLVKLPAFLRSDRIAVYFNNDGEVNLDPLMNAAWKMGKTLYLPVLHPFKNGELVFMEYHPGHPVAVNRFGIPEPISHHDTRCPAWLLDLILTPLVGFDEAGNRMGMGGGFYDRTFAFLRNNSKPRRPTLLGLAHECQKVEAITTESWDIPMDGIVTGKTTYSADHLGFRR